MDGCIYRSQFDLCEKNKEEDEKLGIRRWCDFEGCEDKHPSNADCIRQMSDEELDKFLGEVQWDTANYCGGVTQKQEYPVPEQRGAWLGWLRRDAKEGG